MSKIKKIDNLINYLIKNKRDKKIVLCHGVFDLLHYGHMKYFEEAKKLGDILIVSITDDPYVNKGPNKPAFNSKIRAEVLNNIELIDFVLINKSPDAIELINTLKPNIYCKGPDYKFKKNDITKKIYLEEKAVKKNGGQIKFTSGITFSSSALINKYFDSFTDQQKFFLNSIKKKHSFNSISKNINNISSKEVLIIGETIIDQYVFCEPLGKSGKDSFLTFREINSEKYFGGVISVSNHLSDFCKKINLLTMIGNINSYEKEIKNNLSKNIILDKIVKKNSNTIIKKRYLDYLNKNKIFGAYDINDNTIDKKSETLCIEKLKKLRKKVDSVIILDYGHGFITEKIAKFILKNFKFVSVNAQINSANIGLHSLQKYFKPNLILINENELRFELKNKRENIKTLMKKLVLLYKCKFLIVTMGDKGCILYDNKSRKFHECPAFANKVVDKVGAGDTMISLTSFLLSNKLDNNLSLLFGSIAASKAVESLGNSVSVKKIDIMKKIENVLK